MSRKDRLAWVKINAPKVKKFLSTFNPGGDKQKMVDMLVARHCDSYVPSDTTALRNSVHVYTDFGSGRLVYMGYGNPKGLNTYTDNRSNVFWQDGINHSGLRGPRWAERWFNNGGKEIIEIEMSRM